MTRNAHDATALLDSMNGLLGHDLPLIGRDASEVALVLSHRVRSLSSQAPEPPPQPSRRMQDRTLQALDDACKGLQADLRPGSPCRCRLGGSPVQSEAPQFSKILKALRDDALRSGKGIVRTEEIQAFEPLGLKRAHVAWLASAPKVLAKARAAGEALREKSWSPLMPVGSKVEIALAQGLSQALDAERRILGPVLLPPRHRPHPPAGQSASVSRASSPKGIIP